MAKDKKYSIDDLNELISSIQLAENLNEDEITDRIKYNKGYISQTRARGSVPEKFMEALKREFVKSKDDIANNKDRGKEGQQMASTSQLLETINLLVRQNDKLAETNKILAEKITTIPVGVHSGTDADWDAFRLAGIEFLLEVAAGKQYKSIEDARKTWSKKIFDETRAKSKKGIGV